VSSASLQGGDRAGGWKEPWVCDLLPRGGLGSATTVDAKACGAQGSKQMLPEKRLLIHLNYSFAEHIFIWCLLCIPHGENHGEHGLRPHGIEVGEDIKSKDLKINMEFKCIHAVEERFVMQRNKREIQNT